MVTRKPVSLNLTNKTILRYIDATEREAFSVSPGYLFDLNLLVNVWKKQCQVFRLSIHRSFLELNRHPLVNFTTATIDHFMYKACNSNLYKLPCLQVNSDHWTVILRLHFPLNICNIYLYEFHNEKCVPPPETYVIFYSTMSLSAMYLSSAEAKYSCTRTWPVIDAPFLKDLSYSNFPAKCFFCNLTIKHFFCQSGDKAYTVIFDITVSSDLFCSVRFASLWPDDTKSPQKVILWYIVNTRNHWIWLCFLPFQAMTFIRVNSLAKLIITCSSDYILK